MYWLILTLALIPAALGVGILYKHSSHDSANLKSLINWSKDHDHFGFDD